MTGLLAALDRALDSPAAEPLCLASPEDRRRLRELVEREVGAERNALRAAVEVTLADLDGAIAEGEHRNGKRGGQHVTYTGPLATICGLPGPLNDLRRMAATLRAAIAPTEKTP